MPRYIVDPLFPGRMRELRRARGLSYRQLARRAPYTHTYLWQVEQGERPATPEFANLVDAALGAGGALASMVHLWDGLTGDDDERLALALAEPRRVDWAALDSMAGLLARARRLEDEIGSPTVMEPVLTRLHAVERLAVEARGPMRPRVLSEAAQWAQFGGWLHAHHSDVADARRWYATALEWATEVGDANMVATALSMRGHLAWMNGNPDAAAALGAAAGGQPATPGTRALAAAMTARAHAEMGQGDEAMMLFDRAGSLLDRAAAHPEDEPPWVYFYGPDYLDLQRGVAHNRLGDHRQAAALLRGGLAKIPAEIRVAEWMAYYVYELAVAEAGAGEREAALAALDEATRTAGGSARLAELVGSLRRRIADGC